MFKDLLNVVLDSSEKNQLLEKFKKDYHASEIKKSTFKDLVEAKAVRKYSAERAEDAYIKLTLAFTPFEFEN